MLHASQDYTEGTVHASRSSVVVERKHSSNGSLVVFASSTEERTIRVQEAGIVAVPARAFATTS